MSTLAEIEEAIESLPAPQVEELAAWLNERRSAQGSGTVSNAARKMEGPRSVRDFIGQFASGNPRGADNEGIDADLAREAAAGLS